jgi:predicted esterase
VDAVEHHLEVPRTARYWTLGDPSEAEQVWFVLHGYKQLARRFLKRFETLAGQGRMIVAPEALSRFYAEAAPGRHGPAAIVGASWMTREDRVHEIRDYVTYLDRLAEAICRPGQIVTALGFSQATATVARWVTLGGVRPHRLILWAGYMPHDLDVARAPAALSGVDVVLVRGDQDPGLRQDLAESEKKTLEEAGIAYRIVTYAGGHEIDSATLHSIAD